MTAQQKRYEIELAILDPSRFPHKKAICAFVQSGEFYILFQACIDTILDEGFTDVPPDTKKRARGVAWNLLWELRDICISASCSGRSGAVPATSVPDDYFGLVRSLEALVHHQSMVCAEGELVFSLTEHLPPVLQLLDGLHERKAEFLPNGWCVGGA